VRNFLRPTWVTWVVALLPVALAPLLSRLRFHGTVFALDLALVEIPFAVFYRLGLPVGHRGDWFGYAFPNSLGWTLIALADLVALYLLGCVASAAWTRARRGRSRSAGQHAGAAR
jgi:hypothetical protein